MVIREFFLHILYLFIENPITNTYAKNEIINTYIPWNYVEE